MGSYRIDAVVDDVLYEIQLGSLSAIRDKIQKLTKKNRVVVVRPIVTRKRLVKLNRKNGRVVEERFSPKRDTILSIFDELVYFTRAFPHPNLELHVPLITTVETRYPGRGRRRRRSKNDFQIHDRELVELEKTVCFSNERDLLKLLPRKLPPEFDTGLLSEAMDIQRHVAQRICYCLRKMNAIEAVGKKGNAVLYAVPRESKRQTKAA